MADQNITELPIKTNTGVANTDYMLGIDASEGYQILVRDVAKYIVENYNGSTLAGSAQTPKSAIDALNSKFLYYTDTNSASDGNTAEERYKASIGRALASFSATSPTVNKPYPIMLVFSGSSSGTFVGIVNVTTTAMRFLVAYDNVVYSGTFARSNSTVGNFVKLAKQSDVDDLNSKLSQNITTLESAYGTLAYKCYKVNDRLVGVMAQLAVTSDISASSDVITGLPHTGQTTNYTPIRVFNNTSGTYIDLDLRRSGTTGASLYTRSAIASGASLRMNFVYAIE